MKKDSGMMITSIVLNDGSNADATVFEDIALLSMGREGSFGWATDPNTKKKVGHSIDWPKGEAPSFEEQTKLILDELARKLNAREFIY